MNLIPKTFSRHCGIICTFHLAADARGHDGDGHSHGGHGHSHGGHGHSHGPPQQEPTLEERQKHRERLHKLWDDDEDEVDVG